jgi:hypothetical protein
MVKLGKYLPWLSQTSFIIFGIEFSVVAGEAKTL